MAVTIECKLDDSISPPAAYRYELSLRVSNANRLVFINGKLTNMSRILEKDIASMLFIHTLRKGGDRQIWVLYTMLISKDGPAFIEDMVDLFIQRDKVLRGYLVNRYGEKEIGVSKPQLINSLVEMTVSYLNAIASIKRA